MKQKKLFYSLSFLALTFSSLTAYADLAIYAYPLQTLVNKPISIRVTGIKPGAPVTLDASMTDEAGRAWHSTADFVANSAGVVSTVEQPPMKGSYLTADGMGLFWSMQLAPGTKDQNVFWHTSLNPMRVNLTATSNDQTAKVQVIHEVIAPNITKLPLAPETGLVGNLFLPSNKGLLPTVIVLGGADGGIPDDAYVAQLANQGYAALGLAYYHAPGVPEHFANIPLEYFGKAIAWLQQQPGLNTQKLGIVGTSSGGLAALLIASHYPQIKSVVSFEGSGLVFQSTDPDPKVSGPQSTFTYQGKPVDYIPVTAPTASKEGVNTFLQAYLGGVLNANEATQQKATIPVENIQGPILMLAGTNDELVGSAFLSAKAYERLSEKHYPYFYNLINYNGVGHALGADGLPNTPTTLLGYVGGNPRDTADAQAASWQAVFDFLEKYAR